MDLALRALGAMGALALATVLTWLLEPRLLSGAAEKGAAAPVGVRDEKHMAQNPDTWMYSAGPVVAVLGVVFAVVVIPWGERLVPRDLGIGVFYFIVVLDFVVLGLALGGWGANVRDSVDVYYRGVAQLVAYVVPLGLAYIGAIMMAGSLSTQRIVEAQAGMWFVVLQPIGFVLYLVTGLMQAYRPPFLEPFSAFIGGGVLGSSSGGQAIGWRIAMSATLFLVAAMGAVLYLGGWRGPVLPGPIWMLIKTYGLMALMVWGGARFRLLTAGRMLELSWKILTPVGLANVLVVGALILLGVGPT